MITKLFLKLSGVAIVAVAALHNNLPSSAFSANLSTSAVPTPSQPAFTPAANFVDLWQSAGRGHLSQTDIRAQQENSQFVAQRRN